MATKFRLGGVNRLGNLAFEVLEDAIAYVFPSLNIGKLRPRASGVRLDFLPRFTVEDLAQNDCEGGWRQRSSWLKSRISHPQW